MTQLSINALQQLIVQVVSQHKNGASFDDIIKVIALSPQPPSRRTLHRRVSDLVQINELIVKGQGRGVRYYLSTSHAEPIHEPAHESVSKIPSSYALSLSKESQLIAEYMRQPVSARKPVPYNREFINSYQPNHTYYLSLEIRNHLRTIGVSKDMEKPIGTFARAILGQLLVDLSWNSSRLEGNTYSLLETERLIQFGETAEGKVTFESQMILNHKAAIEFLTTPFENGVIGINSYTIFNLHALLSENLLSNPNASGFLRSIPVGISQSVYYPPAIPQLIEECFLQIIERGSAIKDPFEQAFFLMVQLPYLQPFEDVNKRVSRLAANIPLIRENLSPLSFIDVSEQSYIEGLLGVYEMNKIDLLRDVFVWAYERSSARYAAIRHTLGEPDPFRFRYRRFIKEIILDIVQKKISKKQAPSYIRNYALTHLPSENATQFLEVVETELLSLREGNIARYSISPDKFHSWSEIWKRM